MRAGSLPSTLKLSTSFKPQTLRFFEVLSQSTWNFLASFKTFLKNWVDAHIKEILGDLLNLNKESVGNKYIRALMFQLFENNGVIKRELVGDIVKAIKTEDRKKIWALGIKIGR